MAGPVLDANRQGEVPQTIWNSTRAGDGLHRCQERDRHWLVEGLKLSKLGCTLFATILYTPFSRIWVAVASVSASTHPKGPFWGVHYLQQCCTPHLCHFWSPIITVNADHHQRGELPKSAARRAQWLVMVHTSGVRRRRAGIAWRVCTRPTDGRNVS